MSNYNQKHQNNDHLKIMDIFSKKCRIGENNCLKVIKSLLKFLLNLQTAQSDWFSESKSEVDQRRELRPSFVSYGSIVIYTIFCLKSVLLFFVAKKLWKFLTNMSQVGKKRRETWIKEDPSVFDTDD